MEQVSGLLSNISAEDASSGDPKPENCQNEDFELSLLTFASNQKLF